MLPAVQAAATGATSGGGRADRLPALRARVRIRGLLRPAGLARGAARGLACLAPSAGGAYGRRLGSLLGRAGAAEGRSLRLLTSAPRAFGGARPMVPLSVFDCRRVLDHQGDAFGGDLLQEKRLGLRVACDAEGDGILRAAVLDQTVGLSMVPDQALLIDRLVLLIGHATVRASEVLTAKRVQAILAPGPSARLEFAAAPASVLGCGYLLAVLRRGARLAAEVVLGLRDLERVAGERFPARLAGKGDARILCMTVAGVEGVPARLRAEALPPVRSLKRVSALLAVHSVIIPWRVRTVKGFSGLG